MLEKQRIKIAQGALASKTQLILVPRARVGGGELRDAWGSRKPKQDKITVTDRLSMDFSESIGGDGDVVNGRGGNGRGVKGGDWLRGGCGLFPSRLVSTAPSGEDRRPGDWGPTRPTATANYHSNSQ